MRRLTKNRQTGKSVYSEFIATFTVAENSECSTYDIYKVIFKNAGLYCENLFRTIQISKIISTDLEYDGLVPKRTIMYGYVHAKSLQEYAICKQAVRISVKKTLRLHDFEIHSEVSEIKMNYDMSTPKLLEFHESLCM